VQQVFNGTMTQGYNRTLAIDVFKTGRITSRIVEGQKGSDEMQVASKMRLGYMGHLTLIAEEVVKFTDRHSPDLLSDLVLEQVLHSDWVNYVEVTLAETRERDNAILGGVRPNESIGGRSACNTISASGSAALADAGLNGSAGLNGGDSTAFTGVMNSGFSNNSLMSGFGDSSDEDDEEMDDDFHDDDRGNDDAEVGEHIHFTAEDMEMMEYLETLHGRGNPSGSS